MEQSRNAIDSFAQETCSNQSPLGRTWFNTHQYHERLSQFYNAPNKPKIDDNQRRLRIFANSKHWLRSKMIMPVQKQRYLVEHSQRPPLKHPEETNRPIGSWFFLKHHYKLTCKKHIASSHSAVDVMITWQFVWLRIRWRQHPPTPTPHWHSTRRRNPWVTMVTPCAKSPEKRSCPLAVRRDHSAIRMAPYPLKDGQKKLDGCPKEENKMP